MSTSSEERALETAALTMDLGKAEEVDDHLYQMMRDMGNARTTERYQRLKERGAVSQTAIGATVVAKGGKSLLDAMAKYTRAQIRSTTPIDLLRVRQLLLQLGCERAAAITIQYLLDRVSMASMASPPTVAYMRTVLGHKLREEMEFLYLSRLQPEQYKFARRELQTATSSFRARVKRRLYSLLVDGQEIPVWDRQDCLLISTVAIKLTLMHTGIFKIDPRWVHALGSLRRKAKVHNVIALTDAVHSWMETGAEEIARETWTSLPITTPPLDWGSDKIGGYHRDIPNCRSFMSKNFDTLGAEQYGDCVEVYRAINTLQRTPWRVNQRVLSVMEMAVRFAWSELDIPVPPPERPEAPKIEWSKGAPEWMEHKRKLADWRYRSESYSHMHLRMGRTLAVTGILKDFEKFYYPHFIDFRGRGYPVCAPLQYQGPDTQRGILEFADGKPIHTAEAVEWFMIHGANMWGIDKVPFAERRQWVSNHREHVLACAADPAEDRWWTEADKPFQFLAWCFEFTEFLEKSADFISHLPIQMDGSNNGLQVYSLLLRDPVGAAATNCVPSEQVEDVYQRVADVTTETLKRLVTTAEDPKHRRWAKEVLAFCSFLGLSGLPRKATKRPVMTLPYGATLFSCQKHLVAWYHDNVRGKHLTIEDTPFTQKDTYSIFTWVGRLVWDSISSVVVDAVRAMTWLREISNICTTNGVHADWTSPTGLWVRQHYMRGELKVIHLELRGPVKLQVWEADDRISKNKSANALAPNFIHSLDASAMVRTVNACAEAGVTHFQMIHDSFATHASDCPMLARTLREEYIKLFDGTNLLLELRDHLQSKLPQGVMLPDPPEQGTFDVRSVIDSKYFFA